MAIAAQPAADRTDIDFHGWLLRHIQVGRVHSEEMFRKTLGAFFRTPTAAAIFGLWHIQPQPASAHLAMDSGGAVASRLARGGAHRCQ